MTERACLEGHHGENLVSYRNCSQCKADRVLEAERQRTGKQRVKHLPLCHTLELSLENAHHYEALAGLEAKQHRAAVARIFNKLPESDLE